MINGFNKGLWWSQHVKGSITAAIVRFGETYDVHLHMHIIYILCIYICIYILCIYWYEIYNHSIPCGKTIYLYSHSIFS
jgi:hypothetical protein